MITPTENGISRGAPSQLEDDLRREAAMVPMSLEQRMLFLGAGLASLEARVVELEASRAAAIDRQIRVGLLEAIATMPVGDTHVHHLDAIAWHLEQLRAAK